MSREAGPKVATTRQCAGSGFGWRLGGQREREAVEEEGDVPAGLGAAHEEQFAAIGGGDGDVEQLHGGEFLQDDARHQAGGEATELLAERDRQAVGKKRDEQMRFDPLGFVMKNGPQTKVAFERNPHRVHRARRNLRRSPTRSTVKTVLWVSD